MIYRLLILCGMIVLAASCSDKPSTAVYKDATLSVDERVSDLLSRMTLEEKAAQMLSVNNEVKDSIVFEDDGSINIDKIKPLLPHGIGQITRLTETRGGQSQTGSRKSESLTPIENAALSNAIQRYFVEETRLGIPVIIHEECLHGLVARDATSFPHPIALAGTFDTQFVEQVYDAIAEETRKRGGHQALTPVVDIARDARWGRVEETYGEDPFLTALMGIAAIKGFQGAGADIAKNKIVATLKHFAAHGQPTGGTNTAPANYSERILREVHFYPFKEVIQRAGAMSVMTTYHEIDGVPINANKWLVNEVLRKEWGFEGFVVSDYYSIREMNQRWGINSHRVARNGDEAALLALNAGVNIELPNPDCYINIPELVRSGKIDEKIIDQLVAEMLAVKFKLGLFDDPYIDPTEVEGLDGNREDRKNLAREAAKKSVTLLKNDAKLAPLSLDQLKSIAVIGPNANRAMVGGYTGEQPYHVTVLDGIRNYVGDKAKVEFAEGCKITIGGSWVEDKVNLPDKAVDDQLIKEAVQVAKRADVVLLVVGGNEQTSREAWNNYHLGDRPDLSLFGMQNDLINAIAATGKPIVALVYSGRPLEISNLAEKAETVFQCWYLGQESGNAVADVLFGDFSPEGKLPISFPRSAGHIPVYYNHKPSERRGYFQDDITPLYSFGYGLSYTDFELSEVVLSDTVVDRSTSIMASIQLTNTGNLAGTETVQMYLRDEYSSVTRPVKELKGFSKVRLEPGETKEVSLEIHPDHLKFYDINMDHLVEPGEFTVYIGTSSRDVDLKMAKFRVK